MIAAMKQLFTNNKMIWKSAIKGHPINYNKNKIHVRLMTKCESSKLRQPLQ